MDEAKFWELVARAETVKVSPRARALSDELRAVVRGAFGGQGEDEEQDEDVQSFRSFFGFDRDDQLARFRRGVFGGLT